MTKRIKWPKEVPVLEAEHIGRQVYDCPDGTHCLFGWVRKTFPEQTFSGTVLTDSPVAKALYEAAGVDGACDLFSFNDYSPAEHVAQAWNRAMAKLGYTEDC